MRSPLNSAALVDAWLDTLRADQQQVAAQLRDVVLAACPELETGIKWGNLMFTRQGTHAVAIALHRGHLQLQVFNGSLIAAHFGALEGGGRSVRHLRITAAAPIDEALVGAVVQASVAALPHPDDRRHAA